MACRGVLFAITSEELAILRSSSDDDALLTVVEAVEERWDEQWLCQLDKAWDAIHRCRTDGDIGFTNGSYPLSYCILGGQQLHKGQNYIVSLKTSAQVAEIASALRTVTEPSFRQKYFLIDPVEYSPKPSEGDLEYTWYYFTGLVDFYARVAAADRHVIFTVDQ